VRWLTCSIKPTVGAGAEVGATHTSQHQGDNDGREVDAGAEHIVLKSLWSKVELEGRSRTSQRRVSLVLAVGNIPNMKLLIKSDYH